LLVGRVFGFSGRFLLLSSFISSSGLGGKRSSCFVVRKICSSESGFLDLSIPPPVKQFPEDEKRLYQTLGHGLVRWQYIETGLYLIALGLMGSDHQCTSLAFFHIKSAANKLEFANRLIFYRRQFNKIVPKTKFRWLISSHHLDVYSKLDGRIKALSVENIEHNSEELRMLSYKLVYFLLDYIPQIELVAASLEPHTQHWLDQFRENPRRPGFERSQKSSHSKGGSDQP
jgi:hypothetical protein